MKKEKIKENIKTKKYKKPKLKKEIGGQTGPEPTRYGDWEKNGRVTDFLIVHSIFDEIFYHIRIR